WRPSSSTSSSACASSPSTSPSSTAAIRSASRPRHSSSCTIASTARASAEMTSAASGRILTALLVAIVLAAQRVQLVLEPARLDRAVDAALLRRVRLPPPATRAAGLALADRAGARRAADRRVALRVEGMHRQAALADVVPDLLLRPFGEGVQLHDRAVVVVDLDLADVRPRRPLVAAQAGDPRVEPGEVPRQRKHLAHLAAEQPLVDGVAEQIRTVLA